MDPGVPASPWPGAHCPYEGRNLPGTGSAQRAPAVPTAPTRGRNTGNRKLRPRLSRVPTAPTRGSNHTLFAAVVLGAVAGAHRPYEGSQQLAGRLLAGAAPACPPPL